MNKDEAIIAHNELKEKIVKALWDFTDKYFNAKENPYQAMCIMQSVLRESASEVEYQTAGHAPFTNKQIDHICYQIGEWYLAMKPLLEGTHNLGHMKEKLKIMICGDE